MRNSTILPAFVAIGALVAGASVSCSDAAETSPQSSATPSGGSSSASGGTDATGGRAEAGGRAPTDGSPDLTVDAGGAPDASGGGSDGAVCDAQVREGQRVPVDMYFLVDSSGSMDDEVSGGTKWDLVSSSLIGFVNDPRSAGTGMGIGYFPVESSTCVEGDPGCFCIPVINLCFADDGGACEPSAYATPSVELALPAPTATIVDDINAHQIGGGTPTRPAVEGALEYLNGWASQHPGRKPVLVLATDGEPMDCELNTPQDAADLVAEALSGPSQIQTFVIGVGSSLVSLNLVARAGGTDHAFLVDTGGDVAKEFADALDQIRGQAASCDFSIPEASSGSEPIDPKKVNVSFVPTGSSSSTRVPQVSLGNPKNCDDNGGWYYDDPKSPTTIKLCEATCESLSTGSIQVEFGCDTIEQPPR